MSKSYEVIMHYTLTGHVVVAIEDASGHADARAQAVKQLRAGEHDEDIGVNRGGSRLDVQLLDVRSSENPS